MKVNPGGNLSPNEVVGRDRFIARLWRILDRQSLVLTAERRMGKTSVIKKMVAEVPAGTIAIYRDLEGIKSARDFTNRVLQNVYEYLGQVRKSAERVTAFLKTVEGFEIGGILKLPERAAPEWKTVLRKALEDLLEQRSETIIFFWDEMPLMLYDIKRQEGESVAEEILDELRSLRQTYHNVRMVFTGSIGLHHVMTQLRQAGYSNNPTNDMQVLDLPPIELANAIALAEQLMEGESLEISNRHEIAQEIAIAVDNIPFLIHRLVDHLVCDVDNLSGVNVSQIIEGYMIDPQDPWNLRHYGDRIQTYYPGSDALLALAILDVLAIESEPLSLLEIHNRLTLEDWDKESVRRMLNLLQRDHYVLQSAVNAFKFRFGLIQQYWVVSRGLTP